MPIISEDQVRLILETLGVSSVREAIVAYEEMAEKAIAAGNAADYVNVTSMQSALSLGSTTDAMDAAATAAAEETQALRLMREMLDETAVSAEEFGTVITQVTDAAGGLEGGAAGGKGGGMRGGMRADLILTHAFQNLTSESGTLVDKLEKIGHTIPWLTYMMGIDGPWGMAIALGSAGLIELYKNWDKFMDAIEGDDRWARATTQMKEFAEATERANKALERPSDPEAKAAADTKKVIGQMSGADLEVAVRSALLAGGQVPELTVGEKKSALYKAAAAELLKPADTAYAPGWEQAALEGAQQKKLADAAAQIAGNLAVAGGAGVRARRMLGGLIDAQPGMFPPGMLGDLLAVEPEEQRRQAEREAQGEGLGRDMLHKTKMAKEEREDIEWAKKEGLKNEHRLMGLEQRAKKKFEDDELKADLDEEKDNKRNTAEADRINKKAEADLNRQAKRMEVSASQSARKDAEMQRHLADMQLSHAQRGEEALAHAWGWSADQLYELRMNHAQARENQKLMQMGIVQPQMGGGGNW